MSANNFKTRGSNLRELLHMTCREAGIRILVQLLRGLAPLKFGRSKNVQNLARFRTTLDFDRKCI